MDDDQRMVCCECQEDASLTLVIVDGVPLCWPCWKHIEQVVADEEMTDGRL